MDESARNGLIGLALILGTPILCVLIKWLWLHPFINMERLKESVDRAHYEKQMICEADELLQDIKNTRQQKNHIVERRIYISWQSIEGVDHELSFWIDGKSDTTYALEDLIMAERKSLKKKLFNEVYSMPKRHGKSTSDHIIEVGFKKH